MRNQLYLNCRYECLTRQHYCMFILYRVSQKNGHLSLPIAILNLDLSRINPENSNPNFKKIEISKLTVQKWPIEVFEIEKMGRSFEKKRYYQQF